MVNHPNRNWKKCWQFDAASGTATHESGSVIRFIQSRHDPGIYEAQWLSKLPTDPALTQRLNYEAGVLLEKHLKKESDNG